VEVGKKIVADLIPDHVPDHVTNMKKKEKMKWEKLKRRKRQKQRRNQILINRWVPVVSATTTSHQTNSTPILVGAVVVYAAAAVALFLSTRSTELEEDEKGVPLFKEKVELVNSFSSVFNKHRRQTSDGSDAFTYVADENVTLSSMEKINQERLAAQRICNFIGAKQTTRGEGDIFASYLV